MFYASLFCLRHGHCGRVSLQVHIFEHNSHSHYYYQSLEAVDQEERTNLFSLRMANRERSTLAITAENG
jgi:hypothetical protein